MVLLNGAVRSRPCCKRGRCNHSYRGGRRLEFYGIVSAGIAKEVMDGSKSVATHPLSFEMMPSAFGVLQKVLQKAVWLCMNHLQKQLLPWYK